MPNGQRYMKLYFEDHGQDFLWWEVKDGEVIDCGPFQAWLWKGTKLLDGHVVVANKLSFESPITFLRAILNYPIERIEYLDEEPAVVATGTGAGAAVSGCGG